MLKKIKFKIKIQYHTELLTLISSDLKMQKISFLKNRIYITIGR